MTFFKVVLFIAGIILIIGAIKIFLAKQLNYSSDLFRDPLILSISRVFGTKKVEGKMKGLPKNLLAIVFLISGIYILLSAITI